MKNIIKNTLKGIRYLSVASAAIGAYMMLETSFYPKEMSEYNKIKETKEYLTGIKPAITNPHRMYSFSEATDNFTKELSDLEKIGLIDSAIMSCNKKMNKISNQPEYIVANEKWKKRSKQGRNLLGLGILLGIGTLLTLEPSNPKKQKRD